MENITLAQDVAAVYFMVVFGIALLAQVFEPLRKALRK